MDIIVLPADKDNTTIMSDYRTCQKKDEDSPSGQDIHKTR